jgi:hypothetical protein
MGHPEGAGKTSDVRPGWSVQTDINQTSPEITPAIETRNRAQVGRHMPNNWQSLPKSVVRNARLLQIGPEGILLGECRINHISARIWCIDAQGQHNPNIMVSNICITRVRNLQ